jgi:hypothetical protein
VAVGRGVALLVVGVVIAAVLLDRSYKPASLTQAKTPVTTTTSSTAPTSTTATTKPTTPSTTAPRRSSTTSTAHRGRTGTSHHNAAVPASTTTTAAPTVPPAQVKALVANGTQVSGLAGRVASKLQSGGYDVLSPVNATQQVSSSAVYYSSGSSAGAAEVASALGLSSAAVHPLPSSPPVSSLDGAAVVVVAGPDLANRFPAPAS